MTPINKLTPVTPTLSDKIALWDSSNSNPSSASLTALLTLIEENISNGKANVQYESPNDTGFSVTVNSEDGSDRHLFLMPVAGYDAGTIVMPSVGLKDKQTVLVTSDHGVTTLTISSVKTVNGAPSELTANCFFTLKYDITFDSWYRVG